MTDPMSFPLAYREIPTRAIGDMLKWECHKCGFAGRLWRSHGAFFLMSIDLLCTKCSHEEQAENVERLKKSLGELYGGSRWEIGWRVPAYPTRDLDTLGVDDEASVAWWLSLPCNVLTDEEREAMTLDRLARKGQDLKRSLQREYETRMEMVRLLERQRPTIIIPKESLDD